MFQHMMSDDRGQVEYVLVFANGIPPLPPVDDDMSSISLKVQK